MHIFATFQHRVWRRRFYACHKEGQEARSAQKPLQGGSNGSHEQARAGPRGRDPRHRNASHRSEPIGERTPWPAGRRRRHHAAVGGRPGTGLPGLPHHARPARNRAKGGAGRRAAVRAQPECTGPLYRQARRHTVGHFGALPQAALALARALGHEPAADPQPAPDLPGPAAGAAQGQRPCLAQPGTGPAAHGQAVTSRPQREPGRSGNPADSARRDRAVPERGADSRRKHPGRRCSAGRHAGKPRAAEPGRPGLRARPVWRQRPPARPAAAARGRLAAPVAHLPQRGGAQGPGQRRDPGLRGPVCRPGRAGAFGGYRGQHRSGRPANAADRSGDRGHHAGQGRGPRQRPSGRYSCRTPPSRNSKDRWCRSMAMQCATPAKARS